MRHACNLAAVSISDKYQSVITHIVKTYSSGYVAIVSKIYILLFLHEKMKILLRQYCFVDFNKLSIDVPVVKLYNVIDSYAKILFSRSLNFT